MAATQTNGPPQGPQMSHEEVMNAIASARLKLRSAMPYASRTLGELGMIVDARTLEAGGMPTMAVTGTGYLLIHPGFVEYVVKHPEGSLRLAFIIGHEVLHIALRHMFRAKTLALREGDAWDPIRWNVAADIALNQMLAPNKGLRLPPDAATHTEFNLPEGKMAETYYGLLKGNPKLEELKQMMESISNGSGKRQPGEGTGTTKGACGSGSGGEGLPDDAESKIVGERPKWGESAQERVAKGFEAQVAEYAKTSEGRGNLPAGLLLEVGEAVKPPKVPWQTVLKAKITHAAQHRQGAEDVDWTRPSIRAAGLGWGQGSPFLPKLIERVPRVCVLLDTSGSMGGLLQSAMAEVVSILTHVQAEVSFIACDADVHASGFVETHQQALDLVKGGGGTDMKPGIKKALEFKPNILVCLTDGFIGDVGPDPGVPVVWCVFGTYDNDVKGSEAEGWGQVVLIKEND